MSMWTISHAYGGPHVGVNPCCSSLQEVRIQDTNTSEIGVALLLLFVPNLRSLGGFIYYRLCTGFLLFLFTSINILIIIFFFNGSS